MKLKKILFYHPWIYLKGGAEKVLLEYALHTKHKITVATSYYNKDTTFKEFENVNVIVLNGITEVSIERNFGNILKSFISICTLQVKGDYDLIIISSEGLGDFFGCFYPFFNQKKIAYVHTPLKIIYDSKLSKAIKNDLSKKNWYIYNIIKPIYKIVNKIIWKKYDYVIANSNEVKNRIINNSLYTKQIDIIHPGANIPDNYKEFDLLQYKKTFLVPGRIMWQKRIEIVIDAFIKMNQHDTKLIIMGTVDKKSKNYLKKLLSLIENVKNIKIIDNPTDAVYNKIFNECYSVVFSPECEDWGIIPIESMSLGKPVIAINQCGPKESIVHRKTGYLVDNFDSNSFKLGMEYIYNLRDYEYNDMSINSYEYSKKFSWNEFTSKLDKKIDVILKKI